MEGKRLRNVFERREREKEGKGKGDSGSLESPFSYPSNFGGKGGGKEWIIVRMITLPSHFHQLFYM